MNHSHEKTRRMVGLALFTALVVILQLLGSFIRFGPFSISLVTLPIVVGAVLYGLGRTQKYMHSVFHLFVIAGSVLHLLAILLYVL